MNLENLNLVELNAQELQEAEGGSCGPFGFAWRLALGCFGERYIIEAYAYA
jgi:hypothetical protein